jgi:hypothetical protein
MYNGGRFNGYRFASIPAHPQFGLSPKDGQNSRGMLSMDIGQTGFKTLQKTRAHTA